MNILGIETSCDETGVAICNAEAGIIGQALFSQVDIHARYGGVVPELASRDHIRKISPLVHEVLAQANLRVDQLDLVAYTAGPGLIGALMVGATFSQSFAWGLGVPALGIHHMEGHLLAPMLEDDAPSFPFLALLVSGGHSLLVKVVGLGQYRILGDTLDDAVGEAFDKVAKMMGLGYPGGPLLAKLAESGDSKRFHFPRPMVDRPGLDMSFSGLKTFSLNSYRNFQQEDNIQENIARAFQDAVVDTLAIKCKRALEFSGLNQLVVAGGVGANLQLREKLAILMESRGGDVFFPRPEYCTDNGAMIAFAGMMRFRKGLLAQRNAPPKARWSLEDIGS